MVASFNVPPTTVATGIVMYSLAVAGFVMLGAKLNQRYGSLRVFRAVVALFGVAQVLMTFSPNATAMLTAQFLSGAAGAALVPSLVALIANNYHGKQQATALGALGSARAGAGVAAFLIGGMLGTFIGWRPVFGILIVLSAIVLFLSFRLKPDEGRPRVRIDIVEIVLAAAAIILISFGFNNLNRWGLGGWRARSAVRSVRPLARSGHDRGRHRARPGFLSLDAQTGRGGTNTAARARGHQLARRAGRDLCHVRGRRAGGGAQLRGAALYPDRAGPDAAGTAIAMLPFNLSVFFSALLIIRLYDKLSPRQIGRLGFVL